MSPRFKQIQACSGTCQVSPLQEVHKKVSEKSAALRDQGVVQAGLLLKQLLGSETTGRLTGDMAGSEYVFSFMATWQRRGMYLSILASRTYCCAHCCTAEPTFRGRNAVYSFWTCCQQGLSQPCNRLLSFLKDLSRGGAVVPLTSGAFPVRYTARRRKQQSTACFLGSLAPSKKITSPGPFTGKLHIR